MSSYNKLGAPSGEPIVGTPENDVLHGGDGNNEIWGEAGDDLLQGGAGNDKLVGGDGNDTLDGGPGRDSLFGGSGDDTYIFGRGSHTAEIHDFLGNDTLRIEALVSEVTFSATEDRRVLFIHLDDGSYVAIQSNISHTDDTDEGRIENFVFADGTVWDLEDVLRALESQEPQPEPQPKPGEHIVGTDGDDALHGGIGHDTLDGGAGDDMLFGDLGDDTYIWNPANGNDTIFDTGGNDTVLLDVASSEVRLSADPERSVLIIEANGHFLAIKDYFEGDTSIEHLTFSDGVTWRLEDVLRILDEQTPPPPPPTEDQHIVGTEDNDVLLGGGGHDTIEGLDGDDILKGGEGSDILDGGAGNDLLAGGAGDDGLTGGHGDDTYEWGPNGGNDLILDIGGGNDTLRINAAAADVRLARDVHDPDTLIVRLDGQELRIAYYFVTGSGGGEEGHIENLVFSDGTVWTLEEVTKILDGETPPPPPPPPPPAEGQLIIGTDADEALEGGEGHDTLDGGGGNDLLLGGGGNDTYVWGHNRGNDKIQDFVGDSTILIDADPSEVQLSADWAAGTLFITLNGQMLAIARYLDGSGSHTETLVFSDEGNTVWTKEMVLKMLDGEPLPPPPPPPPEGQLIIGTDGDDTLQGGVGHDTLIGGAGNDTYLWDYTQGDDRIRDSEGIDTLQLGAPASMFSLSADWDQGNLIIFSHGRTMTIEGYFNESGHVENLAFSDGTVWTLEEVTKILDGETPPPPPPPPPPAEGQLLIGTAGNDVLQGGDGNDTLDGGAGDDALLGGAGGDTYRWAVGGGNDTITDARGTDTLSIHATSAEVTFAAAGADNADLVIAMHRQTLVIDDYFVLTDNGGYIENIAFADGSVWQIDSVWKALERKPGDKGKGVLKGGNGKDVLHGNDGDDTISGGNGHDVLKGGNGADRLDGGKGNDSLFGDEGNDQLEGGLGRDFLTSGAGRDTFRFGSAAEAGKGGSRDVIVDFKSGVDRIDLRKIDANAKAKGNNAFKSLLSGNEEFTAAGQLRYDAKKGILYGNTDSDAAAEFQIQLKNKAALLKLSDFLL